MNSVFDLEKCPVGGVDRDREIDRISLQNAVETPFWLAIWAAEPDRRIDVEMSYSDLKIITDLIDQKRQEVQGEQEKEEHKKEL